MTDKILGEPEVLSNELPPDRLPEGLRWQWADTPGWVRSSLSRKSLEAVGLGRYAKDLPDTHESLYPDAWKRRIWLAIQLGKAIQKAARARAREVRQGSEAEAVEGFTPTEWRNLTYAGGHEIYKVHTNPRFYNREYGDLPFHEAREYVRSVGLLSHEEWSEWYEYNGFYLPADVPEDRKGVRPPNIPIDPPFTYRDEWQGWQDWLGYEEELQWRDFEEARDYVRSLGFATSQAFFVWRYSGLRPRDIPAKPSMEYKGEGWNGWDDWLIKWRSFEEAREFVRSLGLTSAKEWQEYCRSGEKPRDIPRDPKKIYGDRWGRR